MSEYFKGKKFERYIIKAINNRENDVIKLVLREKLGREPAKEDLIKLRAAQASAVNDKYILYFDDQLLGSVNLKFTDEGFEVFFIPGDNKF